MTFLIAWFAAMVNAWWAQAFDWRPVRTSVLAFGAVLLALLLFGSARLAFFMPNAKTDLPAL